MAATDADIARYKEAFAAFDKKRDGTVQAADMTTLLLQSSQFSRERIDALGWKFMSYLVIVKSWVNNQACFSLVRQE